MSSQLKIELVVDDKGTVKIKDFAGGVQSEFKKASSSADSLSKSVDGAFKIMAAWFSAGAIISGIKDVTSAYMEQERAVNKMTVAMRNQGDFSEAGLKDMEDFASQLQDTTTIADEAALSMMANLKSYGMLNGEVKEAARAALDFAAAKREEGMTVEQASELIGKAYMGQTDRLKRYGIVIDETLTGAEKFEAVLAQLQARFGGAAAAELETYEGRWKNLNNQFGEVKESLGHIVLEIGSSLMPAIKSMLPVIQAAAEGLNLMFGIGKEGETSRKRMAILDQIHEVEAKIEFYNSSIGSATNTIAGWLGLDGGGAAAAEARLKSLNQELKQFGIEQHKLQVQSEQIAAGGKRTIIPDADDAKKNLAAYKTMQKEISKEEEKLSKEREQQTKKAEKEYEDFLHTIETEHEKAIKSISAGEENQWENMQRLLKEREQEEKRLADERVRNEAASAKDIAESSRQLYEDIGRVTQESYEFKVGLLDKEYEKYRKIGIDKELVDTAYAQRRKELDQEMILSSDNFIGGVLVGYQRLLDGMKTWADGGLVLIQSFHTNASNALSGFISDALNGDINSFKDYWNTFKTGMINDFSEWMAEWATTWAMSELKKVLTDPSTTDSLVGAITFFGDVASKVFGFLSGTGNDIWEGLKDALPFHTGGVVGEGAGELSGRSVWSLKPDEIIAVLQKGEAVISKEQTSLLRQILGTYELEKLISGAGTGTAGEGLVGGALTPSAIATVLGMMGDIATGNVPGAVQSGMVYGITGKVPSKGQFLFDLIYGTSVANAESIVNAIQGLELAEVQAMMADLNLADFAAFIQGVAGGEGGGGYGGGSMGPGGGYGSYGGGGGGYGGLGGPAYATGGIVPRDQIASVHKGEGVFTPKQMRALAPISEQPIVVTVPVYIDGREVSRTIYEGIYDASRRGAIKLHPRAMEGYWATPGMDLA